MPSFLANLTPEKLETLHSLHCDVLCNRLEHYLATHNKEKVQQVAELIRKEDARFYGSKKKDK